jgi:hypothetical protein
VPTTSDREDLLGEDFEWKDEPGPRVGNASGEPAPSRPSRSLESDLARFRKQATASPGRLALLALAVAVAVALAVAVVLIAGGNKETSPPAQTTSTGTTPLQTPPAAPAPTARPAIAVSAATVLRAGDHGSAVRTLQRALHRLGLPVGTLDGVLGPKTVAAVIAFQRAHGLTADGVVGAKTARALNKALAQSG